MRNHSLSDTIQRGNIQIQGLTKYMDISKLAPYQTDRIHELLEQIQNYKLLQESLSAQLHETTQQLNALEHSLQEGLARNISYFAGIWGKNDKRLEEIGGHALSPHHHKIHSNNTNTTPVSS